MNEQKKELIKRMNNLQRLIPATTKAVNDLPDVGELYICLDPGQLRIQIDYKPIEYLHLRRTIAKKWKRTTRHFNELTGNYYVYFKHRSLEGIELTLELEFPDEFENGVTYRLVEIGHKTEPIYGLECNK